MQFFNMIEFTGVKYRVQLAVDWESYNTIYGTVRGTLLGDAQMWTDPYLPTREGDWEH